MTRWLARWIPAILVIAAAPAEALDNPLNRGGSGPVAISSEDGIEWRRDEHVYIATGKVEITRGDTVLTADKVVALYRDRPAAPDAPGTPRPAPASAAETPAKPPAVPLEGQSNGEIYRMEATGNVVVKSLTDTVYGDRGVYDLDKAVVVMTGRNLKLTTPTQVVTARDSMEYWDERQLAVARGNAVAIQSDRRVDGDVLTAHLTNDPKTNESKISVVDAFGNVVVSGPDRVARGGKGVYNLETNVATLVDNVRVTSGRDQINGDMVETNFTTGVSRMLRDPASGNRVKALLVPQPGTPPTASPPPQGTTPPKPANKPAAPKPGAKPATPQKPAPKPVAPAPAAPAPAATPAPTADGG